MSRERSSRKGSVDPKPKALDPSIIAAIRTAVREEIRTVVKDEIRTVVKDEIRTVVREEIADLTTKVDSFVTRIDTLNAEFKTFE